jgi:DNA-binding NarL/FixJ family response regulator
MRIILADHHESAREALKFRIAEAQPEFEVIGEAATTQKLLRLAEEHFADLVLVDYRLPDDEIEQVIARLHALKPTPIVVVMSSEFDCARKALIAGADAFVSKVDDADWLLEKLCSYASRIDRGR